MKRILVYGMTDNPGGIESYLINLSSRLKDSVIFDYITDFPDIAHRKTVEEMGSRVFFIPAKSKKLFAHLRAFYRVLKENAQYDRVYFNILDAGALISAVVPFLMGRKVIVHSHNGDTDKLLLHKICKLPLKLITHKRLACSFLAARYMFSSEKKVTVIPNAIDVKSFAFSQEEREKKRKELGVEDKTVICHIGRLSNQKNPLRLLDIFNAVIEQEESSVLLSVGSGEMEQEVFEYARKIGVSERVKFLGVRADIPELLCAADVFLLPSLYEGLPIVAIEAQSSGLPLVLSDSITKEIDLTDTVRFVSLNESDEVWAKTVLSVSKERYSNTEKIISAGYDINNTKQKDKEILEILGG